MRNNTLGLTVEVKPKVLFDTDMVRHNCQNGHFWHAKMHQVSPRFLDPWKYANVRDRYCPKCGCPQTEHEPF